MNMNDVYAMTPMSVTYDLDEIADHIYESGYNFMLSWPEPNKKIEIRILVLRRLDARRIWKLTSVWFDGQPFMITQNAGREGDDHVARFISDYTTFAQAINYLRTLDNKEPNFGQPPIDPTKEFDELTNFYDFDITG